MGYDLGRSTESGGVCGGLVVGFDLEDRGSIRHDERENTADVDVRVVVQIILSSFV
jgi:hypothetical protein